MTDKPEYHEKEVLEELYHGKGMTTTEIGEKFGVSSSCIAKQMKKNGVKARDNSAAQRQHKSFHNKEVLEKLYWNKGLSIPEIAEMFDVSYATVRQQFLRNDVPRREPGDALRVKSLKNPPNFWTRTDGYEVVKSSEGKYDSDQVLVHRLLAVAEYGFDAVRDNVIHHVNQIPWDNRAENIEIMTQSKHAKQHYNRETGRFQ